MEITEESIKEIESTESRMSLISKELVDLPESSQHEVTTLWSVVGAFSCSHENIGHRLLKNTNFVS